MSQDHAFKLGAVVDRDSATDIVYPSTIPLSSCTGVLRRDLDRRHGRGGGDRRWPLLAEDFAIGAGYHRYFSHRAYETSRIFQFVLAVHRAIDVAEERLVVGGQPSRPPPPFRTELDIHSPRHIGFISVMSAGSSPAAKRR